MTLTAGLQLSTWYEGPAHAAAEMGKQHTPGRGLLSTAGDAAVGAMLDGGGGEPDKWDLVLAACSPNLIDLCAGGGLCLPTAVPPSPPLTVGSTNPPESNKDAAASPCF